jgi:hypothetical protein
VTLAEALGTYIESRDERLSADTATQYRSILQNYSGDWMKQPIASISRERVESDIRLLLMVPCGLALTNQRYALV